MTDLLSLAATLLVNFRTIQFPSEDRPRQASPAAPDWLQLAKAQLADRRVALAYLDQIRRELVAHGYHRFLHHLERHPTGGWRLHLLFADDSATTLLDEITEGRCGAGDPANFDPEEFVRERLGDWVEWGIVRPD